MDDGVYAGLFLYRRVEPASTSSTWRTGKVYKVIRRTKTLKEHPLRWKGMLFGTCYFFFDFEDLLTLAGFLAAGFFVFAGFFPAVFLGFVTAFFVSAFFTVL